MQHDICVGATAPSDRCIPGDGSGHVRLILPCTTHRSSTAGAADSADLRRRAARRRSAIEARVAAIGAHSHGVFSADRWIGCQQARSQVLERDA